MKPEIAHARSVRRGPDEGLMGAAAEVWSAGQQLILDRVDLLQAEVASDVKRLVAVIALSAGAFAVALLGLAVWTAALAVLLWRWLPLDAALALAGGVDVALGAALGALGHRRLSQPTAFDKPTEDTHA